MNHIHSQHWLLRNGQQQQVVSWWVLKVTMGVLHCRLAIYNKTYLKAKEELLKLQYFTMQKYNLKKCSKRNQNPSRYYNSITNIKVQQSQNIIFQKPSYQNRPITLGPKSLMLLYSVMNLNTISLPWQPRQQTELSTMVSQGTGNQCRSPSCPPTIQPWWCSGGCQLTLAINSKGKKTTNPTC